jgi:hypothetical protein
MWKKTVSKGYILYDSNYVTFCERQNYGNGKKIGAAKGGEGQIGRAQRIWGTVKQFCIIL